MKAVSPLSPTQMSKTNTLKGGQVPLAHSFGLWSSGPVPAGSVLRQHTVTQCVTEETAHFLMSGTLKTAEEPESRLPARVHPAKT